MFVRTITKIIHKLLIFLGFKLDPEIELITKKVIIITSEGEKILEHLAEISGVPKDKVLGVSSAVFHKIILHELHGGTVELVEPNGVNKETLDLLRGINGDEFGTDFDSDI